MGGFVHRGFESLPLRFDPPCHGAGAIDQRTGQRS